MKISIDDIEKVSDLIKINLNPAETQKVKSQLQSVLNSVKVIDELNTENIEPMSQTNKLTNVLEEDVVEPGLKIDNYPNRKNLEADYFKVTSLFD